MAPKRFKLFASALMAAAILGPIGFLLSTSDTAPAPESQLHPTTDSVSVPATPATVPEISSIRITDELPPLPPELEGLEPQTNFRTDEHGNLIPDHQLRVLFDFFLANIDREPLATVLQRILVTLDNQLAEPAKSQALDLLERYVGYGIAIEELQQEAHPDGITTDGFDLAALNQRQRELEALRQSHFSPQEIDAFFGEDAQLDNYTLARIEIQQNESITDAQRQRRFQQLEHQLPEPVRIARKRAVIHAEVYEQAQHLKASGASESDLYNLRAKELGEEAATNLARLDREQNQWQERLSHYREVRGRILEAGLSETDRSSAIENLRNDLFEGPERLRVRALDADQL